MNRVKIIHELLRDLEGTAKANGDTEEIREAIMDHVRQMRSEIVNYEAALEVATEMMAKTNEKLKVICTKMGV